ncbi:MAG: WD40 repeat domain-containing protein [candidate division WOR-3 bacterium]|nr:WD40 repeat domain-containing protein [candidate division WOR-3 bacterium]
MFSHKTIKTIITILVLCFVSLVWAEEKGTSQIELIPVYEKTFDDTIVDVIFDTATVSIDEAKRMGWKEEAFSAAEKKSGRGEIFYTKVVISKKGKKKVLKFFDPTGKIKNSIETGEYAEAVISQNGEYIGITTPTKWRGGDHESKFEMVDAAGRVHWALNGLGTGPYVPSPDGRLIIGSLSVEVEAAPIEIYNKNGLLKSIRKDFAGFWTGFSTDGEFIALGIPLAFPRGKLIVLDSAIQILREDSTATLYGDVGGGYYIVFSPSNSYIVYPIIKNKLEAANIGVFDAQGKLLFRILTQGRGNYICKFSSDERYILVADAHGSCYLIDILAKKILWQHIIKSQGFGAVSVNKDFNKILVCKYPNKVYLLNEHGRLLLEDELADVTYHYVPKAAISKIGDKFVVVDRTNKIKSFVITRRGS